MNERANSRSIAATLLLNIPTVHALNKIHQKYNTEFNSKLFDDKEANEDEKQSEFTYDEDDCCWRSAANRLVRLEQTNIAQLCDAERETLKSLAVQRLAAEGITNVTIPKEKRVSPISRWRQLLPLIRKYKGLPESKSTPVVVEPPQKPVFAIDLCQAIENEKAVERAHQIALAKSDLALTAEDPKETVKRQAKEKKLSKSYYERRSSYPTVKVDQSNGEKPVIFVENCSTKKPLTCENETCNSQQQRTSRLIEALCLSSTSASSVCVLNRETEFKSSTPQVPKVMRHTADFIIKNGLNCVHIFRIEGSKARVKKMREDYDNGCTNVITEDSNPYDVAALFKDFIRKLPEPLMTRELYTSFLNVGKIEDEKLLHSLLKLLILLLPVPNRDTLEIVLRCLRRVADNSDDKCDDDGNVIVPGNNMNAHNIAVCMAPNILYRYKGYKTNNPYDIDQENTITIKIVEALIQLTHELFVIEDNDYDEVLKTLLETDPETVDYVLRKKSTRMTFSDMLKSLDEPNHNKDLLRPSSLKIRKSSNRGEESELRKTHSFSHAIKRPRRHASTITAPDYAKLESPNDNNGLKNFSRNFLRMSLGSRDGKSKSCDSKISPRSSPHSSKRSIFRRDKSSNSDIHDLEGSIPEDNRLTCECSTPRSTSTSQERIKMTPPAKDRRRKISLPTFLQSSHIDRGKPPSFLPYKTPSVEIEVFASPTSSSPPPIGRIIEANDDFLRDLPNNSNNSSNDNLNSNNSNHDNNSSTNSTDDLSADEYSPRERFESKTIKEQRIRSIDWTKEEDWPKWQLEVVSSGRFTSPETTL